MKNLKSGQSVYLLREHTIIPAQVKSVGPMCLVKSYQTGHLYRVPADDIYVTFSDAVGKESVHG